MARPVRLPTLDDTANHSPADATPVDGVLGITTDHSPAVAMPIAPGLDLTSDHVAPGAGLGVADDVAHALPALAEAGYEVLEEIGQGGMGVVFKARQRDLNRLVAIKMILAGEHVPAAARARFQTEAQAVAQLRHPAIIQIYDYGQANGMPYFALELAEGGSLKDRLDGSPQLPRESAQTLVELARGVQAAHDVGIVHRDLKPGNVLLGANGELKIGDFGLAKRLEAEDGHTITGQIVGTPTHMAPEQARGDNTKVGPPADVYALGVILYEMLCGRCPFRGTSPISTIQLILDGDLVPPRRLQPSIPRDLETICLKALAHEPNRRYASADDLADDLERFLQGDPILARRTPVWERAYKWARRRPTTVAWASVSMLALIALIVAGAWYWNKQNQEFNADRDNGQKYFSSGQQKIIEGNWDEAKEDLNRALQSVEKRSELAKLQGDIRASIKKVDYELDLAKQENFRKEQERKRLAIAAAERAEYEKFKNLRNDALFHATEYVDLERASPRKTTIRKTALAKSREALIVWAAVNPTSGKGRTKDVAQDYRIVDPLPASLADKDRKAIRSACYELLVLRASTLADEEQNAQSANSLKLALAALDSAERLRGQPTLAIRLRRNKYHSQLRDEVKPVKGQPDDALDYFLVGVEEKINGKLVAARDHFTDCLRAALEEDSDSDLFWAHYLLATCHVSLGEHGQAIEALTPCIKERKDLASLYVKRGIANSGLALAAQQNGQLDSAEKLWKRAADDYNLAYEKLETSQIDNETRTRALYELLLNRGVLSLKRSSASTDLQEKAAGLQKAKADFYKAKTLRPSDWNSYVNLAYVYRTARNWDQAIQEITAAIGHAPKVAGLYRERALLRLAQAGPTPNKSTPSTAVLEDLANAVKHETDPTLKASDFVLRARLLYLAGKFDKTVRECEAALASSSHQIDAHLWRVRALLELEKHDEVLKSVLAYLKGGGKPHVDLYEVSGLAQAKLHDYQSAINSYTMGLGLHDTPALRTHRGMAYLAKRGYGLAIEDFDRAINAFSREASDAARTRNLQASAHVGRALSRVVLKSEYREAAKDADRALELDGMNYRTVYKSAVVYEIAAEAAREAELRLQQPVSDGFLYRRKALALLSLAIKRLPANISAQQFWQDTVVKERALKELRASSGFRELERQVTRIRR